ncbi:MAG: hypothetical protein Q4E21_06790 [Clostridia bacterium]|nr:hypothetical protein [Clostridia bacterium]
MEKKGTLNKLKTTWQGLTKAQKQKWLAGVISIVVLATVGAGTGVGVHLHRQAQLPVQAPSETETVSVSETAEETQPADITAPEEAESESVSAISGKSSTGEKNKNTSTAAPVSNGSTAEEKSGKVAYVHDGVPLRIQGEEVFFPQDTYICALEFSDSIVASQVFVISKYKPYAYFDSSVQKPNTKNKAIELHKDFYWTNRTLREYNITVPQYSYFAPPDSWSQDKKMAYDVIVRKEQENKAIINAFLEKGIITSSQEEQDRLVRENCSAGSYVSFSFDKELPQEILQRDIAYAKELFGTGGVSSSAEVERIQKLLFARADEVHAQTGLRVHYTVEYYPVTQYSRDLDRGVPASKYNVLTESVSQTTYYLGIEYDPVSHLKLDEKSAERLRCDGASPAYLALKKREIDAYTVTIDADAYNAMADRYVSAK